MAKGHSLAWRRLHERALGGSAYLGGATLGLGGRPLASDGGQAGSHGNQYGGANAPFCQAAAAARLSRALATRAGSA